MGPKRKKSRPNTQTPVEQSAAVDQRIAKQETASKPTVDTSPTESSAKDSPTSSTTSPAPGRSSWYGGSWRLKSSPLTETARESISVAQGVTSEALAEGGRQIADASKRPGQYMSKGMRGSRKSIPLVAEPTRVHATSDSSDKSRSVVDSGEKLKGLDGSVEGRVEGKGAGEVKEGKGSIGGKDAGDVQQAVEEAPLPPEPPTDTASNDDAKSIASTTRPQSGSWFGWWSRPDDYGGKDNVDEASSTPLPGTPDMKPVEPADIANNAKADQQDTSPESGNEPELQPEINPKIGSTRSWFGLWSSAQNQQAAEEEQAGKAAAPEQPPEITISAEPSETTKDTKSADKIEKPDTANAEERPVSSGWAFWSTDKAKEAQPTPGGTQKQIGELAVADTPSQSHPEAAQFNEQQDAQATKAKPKKTGSLLRPKRGRADQLDTSEESSSNTPATSPGPGTPVIEASRPVDSEAPKPVQRGKATIQTRPNAITPSFKDSYPPLPAPSYIERVTQYVTDSLHLTDTQPSPRHVYISPTKPKVRRAISIGIHGFFPAPLIQKVLGQPTGTSIRFANYGAAAIKQWCQTNQPTISDVEIEKVALEGEGLINDRIATLWKLMLNWLSHLRRADFILLSCHSQGVPVTLALVAKLIHLGILSPTARIGVCAMAGINLGPFLSYRSRLFGPTALELFDFCSSTSSNSLTYAQNLDICLRAGVRLTYIGSLSDQLVSLESALHAPLSHPYVQRAVFVDGRLHAPNFLSHLVAFACKLRNRGVSDHGLLRELSPPLAGSLVGGDGHSRVYDDAAVYALAVAFALESSDLPAPAPAPHDNPSPRATGAGYPASTAAANSMRRGSLHAETGVGSVVAPYEPPPATGAANPFFLPWAVRGMLEEEIVKREMGGEVRELVAEFEEWRPASKVLKDVRWRLEAVRGMV